MSASLRNAVVAQLIRVGRDVLTSELSPGTNSLLVQLGDATNQAAESDQAQWMGQLGVWARPMAPIAGSAGVQTVDIISSDRDYVIACRDTRANKIPGALNNGDTCIGCTNPKTPAKCTYGQDGTIQVTTPKSSITMGSDGSVSITTNSGVIKVDSSGNVTLGIGASATDGVVVNTKMQTILAALNTWAGAVSSALTSAGFPLGAAQTAFISALSSPIASNTVKASD